ncbi:NAD(P)H-hydrate dehydratase [Lentiprolixibacter aurantiacus]|uniref:Bifunctional NAD(P)H-hydrate repair enzyme n=1 Tax=Lentiprolixibacter aurantiacus TaxID=2993939 RepID=A0AAE3MLG6_9FLAO|nr:NAD(P)H-hydrate dehydratase [Lentiprolixibacter aurantiacus]MCX2719936.1 NAD(P)H-hydrate dehydratase [Lentiprolixibacter aurantiacus]
MKIFDAEQVRKADKSTMDSQKISSDELMERAAMGLFHWIHKRLQGAPVKISLFCGIGNNGGDGLALCRHLWEHGYHIEVFVVNYSEYRSEDFLTNLARLKDRKIWPNYLDEASVLPNLQDTELVIDAIFGIGLNRPPAPWVSQIIKGINNSGKFVLSVDIPSGMFMDQALQKDQGVIHATYVLSFQTPKLPFFLPDTGRYVDQWAILDIGLDEEFIRNEEADYFLTEQEEVRSCLKFRDRFSHKGTYGHALIAGGSFGKIGAVILSARAALLTGCGLLTLHVPGCGYVPLQTAVPEAMVQTDKGEKYVTGIEIDWKADAIGIGIGLGRENATASALGAFLKKHKTPLVLDADSLNILSENTEMLSLMPEGTILTPHPGELARLIGAWNDDFEKLEKAKAFADQYGCVLVIKGAYTLIIHKGKGYINPTGNPGMATAGSGDVLAGIITSLLAQKYDPLAATRLGVYLHGLAGDIGAHKLGEESLTASGILEHISAAFAYLRNRDIPSDPEDKAQEEQ